MKKDIRRGVRPLSRKQQKMFLKKSLRHIKKHVSERITQLEKDLEDMF